MSALPSSVKVTGPLAGLASGFIEELLRQGYTPPSARNHLLVMAHLSRWLQSRALGADNLTPARIAQFLTERRAAGYWNLRSERGLRPLLDHLRTIGAVPTAVLPVLETPLEGLLHAFRDYLITERGLATDTIHSYEVKVRPLLATLVDGPGRDLEHLTAADVNRFVLSESRRRTVASAKNVVTALRALLRFLHQKGRTALDLSPAVPTVAGWRGGDLPRALDPDQVDLLLSSCNRTTEIGRRDFAILTLLARLGLRASEVASIELDDFDWKAGEIVIRGKGNLQERLPLLVDVGEAVAAYLLERPRVQCRRVFLRPFVPIRGMTGPSIGLVVRRACKRAGIPPVGAHRLRHTVATEMLRNGASLPEVGQVLRHRKLSSTAVYAKVDRVALRTVVQPWPERRP